MNDKNNRTGVRPEWRGRALRFTLAGTVYLLATGLVILLVPFGTGTQISVWAHTLLGLLWLLPFLLYLPVHLARRYQDKLSHLLLLGWMAGLLLTTAALSGVVLTVQAAFGRRIDYGWDLVHIVSGCAVAVIAGFHLWTAIRRGQKGEGRYVRRLLAVATAAGLLAGAATYLGGNAIPSPERRMALPEGYGFRYGQNPFAPSLANTDWLHRVERDRHWERFLAGLLSKPSQATPATIADFLEAERALHEDDRLSRERGDAYTDALEGYANDAARIAALEQAAPAADRSARIAKLLETVRGQLAKTKRVFAKRSGIRPASLAGSRSCGVGGCHQEIFAEWQPSAHRYASRSAFFQLIQGAMAKANGAESTRYCAGCHDPISLFSGAKNIFEGDLSGPGADEGISCAVCHRIVRTDVQGNANYVLSPPRRYLAEKSFWGRFLIRAYPRHHKQSFGRPLLATPEFCGACHKQFIDKELNRSTRVQLQNQYDDWKGSHWFVPDAANPDRPDPKKSLACRDCHMRLVASGEPAAFETGKHRHHGYIAANQWLPLYHKLPHAKQHVRLTEDWLQGKTVIPEIADRWPGGPPVPLSIEAPKRVRPGEKVKLRVVAVNRKVGHTFPTGPLDVIQAWIEVTVKQGGKVVFHSGGLDKDGFIEAGAWILKAEGVDRAGNLIDRHNLWDMVGARFKRVLFPGYSDEKEYTFTAACQEEVRIPESRAEFRAPEGGEDLDVLAVLHYRKVDQTLLNALVPDGTARAPITDMSRAQARIRVEKRP